MSPKGVYPHPLGPPPEVRFWAKVDRRGPRDCWLWTGGLLASGYGSFCITGVRSNKKNTRAHRYAYELLKGPIPGGLQLDHLCRTPACVNPAHLEPVTAKVNTLRGRSSPALNALKTECSKGHPFDEKNTRITPRGTRKCRRCRNDAVAEWKRKQAALRRAS